MESYYKIQIKGTSSKILFTLVLLFGGLLNTLAYKQTYNVNVGETFTVYATYQSYTQSVLWTYDWSVVEPVTSIYATTTSVTFRAIAPSLSAGSVIQAVTYYYRNGTTSSGINKAVDDWKVVVKDNSTVSLNKSSMTLSPNESEYLYASASSSSYSGNYTWSSSYSSVAYISGSGSSVRIVAQNSGYTTITVRLDNGNSAQCGVTVRNVEVSSATVSPSSKNLVIDETAPLSLSVSPIDAVVTSKQWKSMNSNVASVSSSGTVTGISEGRTEIYCIVNGNVTSSSCYVSVSKPNFTLSSSSPSNNATGQSVFTRPSLTFCRQIFSGNCFSDITLKDSDGSPVIGTPSVSGAVLTFSPSAPLEPNTSYTLFVPSQAVRDKYGSTNSSVTRTFTTGNLQKLTLSVSTTERFLSIGEKITLSSTGANVSIFYTLDGTTPTEKSTKYQDVIVISQDIKLRAIAMGAGYENSDVLSQDYFVTNVDVVKRFPTSNNNLYEYQDINPYITFSNVVVASSNLKDVKLRKGGEDIDGDILVADSSIFFIPKQPLDLGCCYQMSIPSDAIKTWQGESNDETSWSFCTGDFVKAISAGSEIFSAIKTDGSLLTWGRVYKSGNSNDGSFIYNPQLEPTTLVNTDVYMVDAGYMHNAMIKTDGSLWIWGRQYCGEFGNNSTIGSEKPVKVMEAVASVSCGGQTTAIIKTDNTLWMVGRNDFGQIGDSTTVVKYNPVKILDEVRYAIAGWCVTFAIKTDGSLWGWGRNDKHQLGTGETTMDQMTPLKVMDDVAIVATSATESQWVAVIKTDGSLWAWGEVQPTPTKILDDVCSVAVGADYIEAVKDDGTLWALGGNDYGQLGNGTTIASTTPIKVMENVTKVASGGQTTMVNMQDGSVWTWGRNNTGTLGNGTVPSLTAYNEMPTKIIEGHNYSTLQGITSRKKTYYIVEGGMNVIDAVPVPLNAIYKDISWSSDDNSIVSVSERGIVKGESHGETNVYATIKNEKGEVYTMSSRVIVVKDESYYDKIEDIMRGIKVWANNHQLHIHGLQSGQRITIYYSNGTLVYHSIAKNHSLTIPINNKGIYIVRIEKSETKVLVR